MRWLYRLMGFVVAAVGFYRGLPVMAVCGVFLAGLPTLGDIQDRQRRIEPGGALGQALDAEIDELNAELRFGLECLWIEYADGKLTMSELESCAERQYAMYDAQTEKVNARRPRPRWATEPSVFEAEGEVFYGRIDTAHCQCEACRESRRSNPLLK